MLRALGLIIISLYWSKFVSKAPVTTVPTKYTLEVRLADGPNTRSGRVEVNYDGIWGTVCDDNWDMSDAEIVCGMLGYPGVELAPGGARYGEGSGPIILDDVRCEGSEDNLEECLHNGFLNHNCSHAQDASVVCQPQGECKTSLLSNSHMLLDSSLQMSTLNQWFHIRTISPLR